MMSSDPPFLLNYVRVNSPPKLMVACRSAAATISSLVDNCVGHSNVESFCRCCPYCDTFIASSASTGFAIPFPVDGIHDGLSALASAASFMVVINPPLVKFTMFRE
ncbi:SpoIIIAH-like protein [Sesbania bispinosa]|nr:SpoIIIAH-like protein [Sesbania bispinosa]